MDSSLLLEEVLGLLKTFQETIGVPQGESLTDKNISGGDPTQGRVNPTLSSSEKKRVDSISTIFAEAFLKVQNKYKKDDKPKTLIRQMDRQQKGGNRKEVKKEDKKFGWGMMLAGLLLLLGGVGALIMGLLSDGPFKGALKMLAKFGIKGGLKIIMSGVKRLLGVFADIIKYPFKILSKTFGGLVKSFKGAFSSMSGKLFGGIGKKMGGGILAKMLKSLKPLFSILKKIPLLGSLISIGFAISRFKSGDNVGGVIDVLSALAGLLYLVPGAQPIAFALTLGLDLLNVWMDVKSASPENKGKSKMDILGDMAKGIGSWIWKNALWIPVIGGFKRMAMSWDAFKGGDVMEGLKQFAFGLLSFGGLSPIITGIEMLLGMGGEKEGEKKLTPNKGWFANFKEWIGKKLKKLPYILRKPLEWFGIIDSTEDKTESLPTMDSGKTFDKVSSFASKFWDGVKNGFDKISSGMSNAYNAILPSIKEFGSNMKEGAANLIEKGKGLAGKIGEMTVKGYEKVKEFGKSMSDKLGVWYSDLIIANDTKSKNANQKTPQNNTNISVNQPSVSEKVEVKDNLLKIGMTQANILNEILKVNRGMLKAIGGISVGGGTQVVNSQPTANGRTTPTEASLGKNRSGFAGSPYSLT